MFKVRERFRVLKKQGRKAFIPYLTYGYPNRRIFEKTLLALDEAGCDIIEVGMPFSDPVADGPVIQQSSQTALKNGATLPGLLKDLKRLRSRIKTPIALMTYYNPVFFMGVEKFCRKASGIVDALIVPDLLPEEGAPVIRACRQYKIATVFFAAPTTDPKRLPRIDKSSSGFVYYVSVTGTTGIRHSYRKDIFSKIKAARKKIRSPLCVGFGISDHRQVEDFSRVCDGVIVGSAIIKFIGANYRKNGFIGKLKKFVLCMK